MPLQKVKLAELVEDWDIYPRHDFDSGHVRSIVDALASGVPYPGTPPEGIPPIVVARKGMRIVDGWHRTKALRRFLGVGAEVDADVRSYKTEADVVRDAVRLNSGHGRKLDEQDKARSALLLERHGVVISEIKMILSMPEEKIRTITASPGRIVVIPSSAGDQKIPAKPSARSSGAASPRVLTPEQATAHSSSSGWSVGQTAGQLVLQLSTGLTTAEHDPAGVAALWRLYDAIEKYLVRPAA